MNCLEITQLELLNVVNLKARLLCEGVNVDAAAEKLFCQQNPSGVKRGGLSSGGKMRLDNGFFVNVPFYRERNVGLKVIVNPDQERSVLIQEEGETLYEAEVLPAPDWYGQKVGDFDITQVLTAHNRQLAGAVYENCALFAGGIQCEFCVMNRSLKNKDPRLISKKPELFLAALEKIPVCQYGGLTLNGGMTFAPGRGMELIEPVVRAVRVAYPDLPIAVEITPPADLDWIDQLAEAGTSSLMMNLESWDAEIRAKLIPGKNQYCSREQYLVAFDRAVQCLGKGRVSTCFVVGTEPIYSLKKGIKEVIRRGVVPSPLAGRYFEDVLNYPFRPAVDYRQFVDALWFAKSQMWRKGLISTDKAGCVACRMCDLILDII